MVTQQAGQGQGRLRTGGARAVFLAFAWLCLALSMAGPASAAQGTSDAVVRCLELVPGFDEHAAALHSDVQGSPDKILGVRVSWTRNDPVHGEDWIICWFLPLADTNGIWQIDQVQTHSHGRLMRYDVQQLYKLLWLRRHDNVAPTPKAPPSLLARVLYALQQTINGLTLGCLYALLAVSFNLVYGIARFINLAFGELYMLGAFATYLAYALAIQLGAEFTLLPILATAAYVIATGALAGWSVNRLVFSRMETSATTVPLIASIGLSLLISNAVLLLQGPKTRWMPQYQHSAWRVIEGLGYDVYLRKGHVLVGLGTAAIAGAAWWAARRSDFGRRYRACAQDPRMAALLGVDVRATVGLTFAVSGALTGAAGLFEALQYNAVDFHMGFIVAIKALTAALLGGIGSVPGAILGGFLLAGVETYSGVLIGFEWRDVIVFGVLAMVLVFRPGGLCGTLRLMPADERP
jgi:branched-chain amino acid transport system permease protein